MTESEYIKNHIESQIKWYSSKSRSNKKMFKLFRYFAAGLALLIPLATGFITDNTYYLKLGIGTAGVIIAFCEILLSGNQYQENWINYRTTSQSLKQELRIYYTKRGPYKDQPDPFDLLVNRVENIISEEKNNWSEMEENNNNTSTPIAGPRSAS